MGARTRKWDFRSEQLIEAARFGLLFLSTWFALANGQEEVQQVLFNGRAWRIEGELHPAPHVVVMTTDN